MAATLYSLAVLLLLIPIAAAQTPVVERHSNVATLTSANFDSYVGKGRWLVEFYAPWCGHCKHLAPIWEATATELKARGSEMRLAKVDATAHADLKAKYEVSGFPSLRLFEGGEMASHYSGRREKEDFLQFDARLSSPAVARLPTRRTFESYCFEKGAKRDPTVADGVTFMLVLPPGGGYGGGAAEVFGAVATELRTSQFFAATDAADVAELVGGGATPATAPYVVRVEKGEEGAVYGGDVADQEELTAWVMESSVPLLAKLDSHNFFSVSRAGRMLVIGCVDFANEQRSDAFVEALGNLARRSSTTLSPEVRAKYNFGYLDGQKWASFISQFNVEVDTLPRVVVLDAPNGIFFEDESVDEEDEIDTFLNEIAEGMVTGQYEGTRGMPRRMYRKFMRHLPWSVLGLLGANLALVGLVWCVCCNGGYDEDETDLLPPPPHKPEGLFEGAEENGGGGGEEMKKDQ